MLKRVDYDDHQHRVYERGRRLWPEQEALWRRVFAEHAPSKRPLAALDLGSGTGRFTPILADLFGGPVWGVEPSDGMRSVAETSSRHPAVTYLAGEAARIPLPDDCCDLVLMFLSLHHVPDRRAGAHEIARVLKPGGRVLIRSTLSDRMPDIEWHRYFPRARDVELQMFPTSAQIIEEFGEAGIPFLALVESREMFAPSLAAHAENLRLRAISVFEHLTEDEIAEGFERLDRAVEAEVEPTPIVARCDLLVFEAPQ